MEDLTQKPAVPTTEQAEHPEATFHWSPILTISSSSAANLLACFKNERANPTQHCSWRPGFDPFFPEGFASLGQCKAQYQVHSWTTQNM